MRNTLNSEQNKAVRQLEGPVLILAGAGSGKTATMTHRMAYMIEQGIDPHLFYIKIGPDKDTEWNCTSEEQSLMAYSFCSVSR